MYNGKKIYSGNNQSTKTISIRTSATDVGPTSARLKSSYDAGDANVVKSGWENIADVPNIIVTGLKPGRYHKYIYYVETDKGAICKSSPLEFPTPSLELEVLTPKCVSSTNAIVAAKTNITNDEPNVGFQWKKYDAPATLVPSEGYAVACDGIIEGYLRNLQPTSFYNLRAFYKDANGEYYFSEWITFDPSDFSFFEPTVRTYPIEDIGEDHATLRGYVLAGTDNIISQGFQYWMVGSASKIRRNEDADTPEIHTVTATGQIMTASISDLQPGTTYAFRAFVETEAGFKYGEEQTFETAGESVIGSVMNDGILVEIIGYVDMSGRRYDKPRKGLNIVLYSDGTTRKIVVR